MLANLKFRGISIFADEGLTAKTAKIEAREKKPVLQYIKTTLVRFL